MHDYNADARHQANAIRQQTPDTPRGAFHTGVSGVCLAFGNDDFAHDDRARMEVTLLRQSLRDAGLAELGFGISDDGRTWVMLVQANDANALAGALLDAHQRTHI